MANHRLFCQELAVGEVSLGGEESHHAIDVLRVKPGDCVELFDGSGRVGEATVVAARKGGGIVAKVAAVEVRPFDTKRRLTVAVAMPRGHRQGYLIEKCTELGVFGIWPIHGVRSVTKVSPSSIGKLSRRAREACKQSGRAWVPIVADPMTFSQAIRRAAEFDLAILFDPAAEASFVEMVRRQPTECSMIAYIGPEGGWSAEERAEAGEQGVPLARLAPTTLRTETAAVAACAAVASLDEPG